MKFTTRDTDYAIRILVYIAYESKEDKEIKISAEEIANELGLPKQHVRLLLKQLSGEGFLNSFSGKAGGFTLAKDPNKITMFQIIKKFQPNVDKVECTLKKEDCPNIKKGCKMRDVLLEINAGIIKKYKSLTIASLM